MVYFYLVTYALLLDKHKRDRPMSKCERSICLGATSTVQRGNYDEFEEGRKDLRTIEKV